MFLLLWVPLLVKACKLAAWSISWVQQLLWGMLISRPWSLFLLVAVRITDVQVQVLHYLGGQTSQHTSQQQLAQHLRVAEKLRKKVSQQELELQDVRDQLAAATAIKHALTLKYRHARSLNMQLQSALQDMQQAASAAALAVRKHNAMLKSQAADSPNGAAAVEELHHSPYMEDSSSIQQQQHAGGGVSNLKHILKKATPGFMASPAVDTHRHQHHHPTSSTSPTESAFDEPDVSHRATHHHHPAGLRSLVWGTHTALLAACVAMRWCGVAMLQLHTSLQKQQAMLQSTHGMPSTCLALITSCLPLSSTYYTLASWSLAVVYFLWFVRLLPSARAVNSVLLCAGWVMCGYCLQAGWMSERLLTSHLMPNSSSGAGVGTSRGSAQVWTTASVPQTYPMGMCADTAGAAHPSTVGF